MDLTPLIEKHLTLAPILVFLGAILAGLNIPISIDLLLIFCIYVYGAVGAKFGWMLFAALMAGCIASSHLAYAVGRYIGPKILKIKFFHLFISSRKLKKVESFYKSHGNWLYFASRFVPFGVRNVVFYSSGISKVPFFRFSLLETCACLIWGTSLFSLFTSLSTNYETLVLHLKWINIFAFISFSVTVIGFIWYKVSRRVKILR